MAVAGARRLWAGMALALLFCVTALPAAWAKDPAFPALTGRVVDDAGILSDSTRQNLTGWLEGFERDTKRQVVVATVKSLQGVAIEDYGVGLGRAWGIGQKGKNTGAILLVAPNERTVRIEVGYGLEGKLTDALSRSIIEQQIVPSFKQGDYDTGVINGTAAMLNALGWKGAPPPRPVTAQPIEGPGPGGGFDWSVLLYFGFIFIFMIFRGLFGLGRRSRPGFWGTSSSGWGGGGFSSGSGGFSGGGGSFGGGGASGRW